MNPRRKIVMWVGIALGVAAGIYPPWLFNGYGWLWDDRYNRHANGGIDIERLLIEWAVIAAITVGAFFSIRKSDD